MDAMATLVTAVSAFLITSISGVFIVPWLRKRKVGQIINDIGPTWHKKKQGIPTMGGLMFIIGILLAVAAGCAIVYARGGESMQDPEYALRIRKLLAGLGMTLAYTFIGFMDDYTKVTKKRNLGLTAKQKIFLQILVGIAYLGTLWLSGDRSTLLVVPPFGQLDIGLFYYPLALFIIVGFVNAVNLTDGIDGLAGSVTFVAALGMMIICGLLGKTQYELLATALAGGCLGFLVWNFYPAKVIMGDTGSAFLGGCVVALCFSINMPIIILLVGIIYLVEAFSVIIQVLYYKRTKKRLFKMSPIHHHFEMSGYSEVKIVLVFSLVTLLGCALAVLAVFNM